MKTKSLNLGLVFCLVFGLLLTPTPAGAQATQFPPTSFWNDPPVPSIFDSISFGLYDYPPADWVCSWNFGDGTFYNECWVNAAKQYSQDGDYTVSVMVTTGLGETASVTRVISVRTHDVSILRLTVPKSARAGQTRQVVVDLRNSRYAETVRVELYRSTPSGFVQFGSITQLVPVRPVNRTTPFSFNYTFTAEDARVGKVTFQAMAILTNSDVRDAWPVDNLAISLPISVMR